MKKKNRKNDFQGFQIDKLGASDILMHGTFKQEPVSQEKRAEYANRLQSTRNPSNNKSSSFRGKFVNSGDINMYGTHVNGEKRKSRELVRKGLKHQSTVTAVSDALNGRYPLERNIRAVTFCHDDFMKIVELIAKVADSQLREDIVMAIIEAKSNAHDLLER